MHSLFDVLDELDHASLVAQRRLTIPFLREALESRLAGPSQGVRDPLRERTRQPQVRDQRADEPRLASSIVAASVAQRRVRHEFGEP